MSRLIQWAKGREPDFVIGGEDNPYLKRWYLIPRNPVFNIYVHQFLRSDDDRALHTHPWLFNCSVLLDGEYREWTSIADGRLVGWPRYKDETKFRWGKAAHRIELTNGPCWTLFITGPVVRNWGFLCPKGFVPWQEFTDVRDKGSIGKGCGE